MLGFKNTKVYLNNKKVVKTDLAIINGKFSLSKSKDAKTLPAKYIIVPGFIEQHIHGANGSDVMDGNDKSLHNIAKAITRDGVTCWCPTTMSMSKQKIIRTLKTISNKKHQPDEAKIAGVHLEGPFINKNKKGAHNPKYILKPNLKDLKLFLQAADNKIKIITITIENCSPAFIKYLNKNNITISVGHSLANGSDVIDACKLGLSCVTHVFNAMQKNVDKNKGIVGQLLLHKKMYGELILDLKHVSQQQALVLKNHKNLILITDSNEARFMPQGIYHLGNSIIYLKNGITRTKHGQLAGSVLTIPQALRNAQKIYHYSFEHCIDLVCKNPANNLHIDSGIIKNKAAADFVIVDKNFNVYQTYVNGKLVYSKRSFKK